MYLVLNYLLNLSLRALYRLISINLFKLLYQLPFLCCSIFLLPGLNQLNYIMRFYNTVARKQR